MAMVDVNDVARRTSGPSRSAWFKGRPPPLGAVLRSSNKHDELSQRQHHDDSTINTLVSIIIVIIIITPIL